MSITTIFLIGLCLLLLSSTASITVVARSVNPINRLSNNRGSGHGVDHFAVRRGQQFYLLVELSDFFDFNPEEWRVYLQDEDLVSDVFITQFSPQPQKDNFLSLRVETKVLSPVGKFSSLHLIFQSNDHPERKSIIYPCPTIYLLFNPYLEEDEEVFLEDEKIREETIMNEYGNIYQGSLDSSYYQTWYYGQSHQIVLDAAFHLIDTFGNEKRVAAWDVVQCIAHNQGMMRNDTTGEVFRGSESSLLE
eukprot:Awhi_evm1s1026